MVLKDTKNKKSLYGDLALLFVAIVWGSGFVVTKNSLESMTPLYMNAGRFTISTILMMVVFWKRLKSMSKQNLKAGLIIGLFLYLGFAAQTIGLQFTTASSQAFLTGTNVIMVPFIYWFIKNRKPDNFEMTAAFLTLIGIGMITLNQGLKINSGDMLTLLCALLFAGHIVSVGCFTEDNDPIILTVLQLGVAAVLSIISAIIFEPTPQVISSGAALGVLYLGVFSTLIAFLLQNLAQKYTSPTHAAIIMSLESVFGTLLAVILLGEIFTLQMLFGCLVIFGAIITAETKWMFLREKFWRKEEVI
jgi:drug/metabolite transporter (DMT)-like permease